MADLRKIFLVTMGGSDELSGYAFAIGTAWALGFTLLRRANVRVDALYNRLPPALCAVLDIVALLPLALFLGTLAAGGTLGILIPPSIDMIIYAVLTDTSIPKLYLAGIIPGLGLAFLFMVMVAVFCMVRPAWGDKPLSATWGERLRSLVDLIPPLGIFLVVVGSIYAGLATPTEAASLGVVAALGPAAAYRRLSLGMLKEALENTMRTTAMVMLIIIAAYFLNFVISAIGLTTMLTFFPLSPCGCRQPSAELARTLPC